MSSPLKCENCENVFDSRNKLFKHLRFCTHECPAVILTKRKFDESNTETENIMKVSLKQQQQHIEIIDEDETWYRVILKPQGIATMGMDGRVNETLMNSNCMLLENAIKNQLSYKKAVPCHRLDRATGGLVICSKSKEAESSIMTSFRLHEVKKRYRAIVKGFIEDDEGIIDLPISNQPSQTLYKVTHRTTSHRYKYITTVDLWPVTGRKHQLRRHLQEIGHPILGDQRYSSALDWPNSPYQDLLFLWSLEVTFPHKGQTNEQKTELNTLLPSCVNNHHENEREKEEDNLPNQIESKYPMIRVEIPEPAYYEEYRQYESKLALQHDGNNKI
jgi:23S rRNA-/tRNA-specific pseudouridylate synthase